jgi:signal peptidase I
MAAAGDRTFEEFTSTLPPEEPAGKPEESETFLEAVASTCVLFVCFLFVTTFIAQQFVIPSGSMENTLLIGDHVLVDRSIFAPAAPWDKLIYHREPRHGDVIVFLKPNPESPDLILVKRLIGVPGDHIHLIHGIVYLNGVAQNEPYAIMPDSGPNAEAYDPARDDFPAHGAPDGGVLTTATWTNDLPSHLQDGDLVVPPGRYFAMGDNRTHSADSRFWGFVPRENLLGRPLFNYWSFKSTEAEMDASQTGWGAKIGGFFHTALHFFDKTRWNRTGHVIR